MEATAKRAGPDPSTVPRTGRQLNVKKNVKKAERQWSLAIGVVLIGCGLTRVSGLRSLLLTGLGAALAYRGATGHCHVYKALGIDPLAPVEDDENAIDRGPWEPETEFVKNQVDKDRFDKLKTAQVDRGRDEERAIEIAAEEVKELRRREGRSKDDENAYPDENDEVWERK